MATETSPGGGTVLSAGEAGEDRRAQEASVTITADDLRQIVRALGLVDVPDHLMPKVLEHVRAHRESMRTFDGSGIDLAGVVTAQPFRA